MNVEALKSIISNPAATPDEKQVAREKLRQLEPSTRIASEANDYTNEVERFLIALKLDDLAERYLTECGARSFIDCSQGAGISEWWINAEWEKKPDRVNLERKLKRLRALRAAAFCVRDCWISLQHGNNKKRIDPVICELLGIDLSADVREKLGKAQTAYIALAAEGRTGDE